MKLVAPGGEGGGGAAKAAKAVGPVKYFGPHFSDGSSNDDDDDGSGISRSPQLSSEGDEQLEAIPRDVIAGVDLGDSDDQAPQGPEGPAAVADQDAVPEGSDQEVLPDLPPDLSSTTSRISSSTSSSSTTGDSTTDEEGPPVPPLPPPADGPDGDAVPPPPPPLVARALPYERSFPFGPFIISKVFRSGVHSGWGATCNCHTDPDYPLRRCKINMTLNNGSDEQCILALKRWLVRSCHIDQDPMAPAKSTPPPSLPPTQANHETHQGSKHSFSHFPMLVLEAHAILATQG